MQAERMQFYHACGKMNFPSAIMNDFSSFRVSLSLKAQVPDDSGGVRSLQRN